MRNALAIVLILGTAVSAVRADVKVVRSMDTESATGFGGGTREMVLWLSGDKHREEQKTQGKPSMFERMAGIGNPVITRLDKKLRWTINPAKKVYQEHPLVAPTPKTSEPEPSRSESSGEDEKPTMKITKAEFKVTPLNQKKTLNNYPCEGYQMKMLLQMEDLQSHERSEMKMISTIWATPETGALLQLKKEEEAYSKAYLKAIGITDAMKTDLQSIGGAMLVALAGSGEKELSSALSGMPNEMKKIKGYPIHTRVEWYGQEDDASPNSDDSEAAEIPTDVSSALGNLAAGFAKKKMEGKKPAATAEGRVVLAMSTEVKAVDVTPIPADVFEVPAGFKKTK